MAWCKFNPLDFLEGSEHLTLEERGAYITLLCLIYRREGPLPDDSKWLAARCLVSVRRWNQLRSLLVGQGKFYVTQGGGLMNKRAFFELEKLGIPQDKLVEMKPVLNENSDLASTDSKTLRLEESPLTPLGGQMSFLNDDVAPVRDDVRTAFEEWNVVAKRCGLPIALTLDEGRRKAIRARFDDGGGLQAWREALRAVEVSRLCRGLEPPRRGSVFRADLDFVCQRQSFRRLREGSYGNGAPPPAGSAAYDPLDIWRSHMREFTGANDFWDLDRWGPKPGREGCRVPPEVLREFGFEPSKPSLAAG